MDWAKDGETALHIMNTSPEYTFDLILMDIQMPYMDGFKATEIIRNLPEKEKANIERLDLSTSPKIT